MTHSARARHPVRRAVLAAAVAIALAAGGATAWALDRFVISHVAIADVDAYVAQLAGDATSAEESTSSAGVLTDTTYTSDDATISLSTVTSGSGDATVTYYVADVTLADATVLHSAFAGNAFGTNIIEESGVRRRYSAVNVGPVRCGRRSVCAGIRGRRCAR